MLFQSQVACQRKFQKGKISAHSMNDEAISTSKQMTKIINSEIGSSYLNFCPAVTYRPPFPARYLDSVTAEIVHLSVKF